jgi:hypothetical protein
MVPMKFAVYFLPAYLVMIGDQIKVLMTVKQCVTATGSQLTYPLGPNDRPET